MLGAFGITLIIMRLGELRGCDAATFVGQLTGGSICALASKVEHFTARFAGLPRISSAFLISHHATDSECLTIAQL